VWEGELVGKGRVNEGEGRWLMDFIYIYEIEQ
jgi:hypothetical protein